ncbi:TPA: hypothetical protein EYP84_03335, partial [Candidatus Bipolaricaulota bacterium]|nr:hypothetical protein [Candidatus Bipolaricaulota bacterium]
WCEGELARYPLGWGGFGNPFREADCARTIAPAYDWIYNTLSDEERKFIEDSLREKALYWLDDCVKFRFPANMNQGAVFGSGYALAVLVLRNRYRDIEPLVQRALDAMHRVCALYFGDDGWAPEGFGYWAYTMNTAITALTPLARATKIDIRKWLPHGLRRGILYPFHMRSLASQTFAGLNFNDAHYRTRPPSAVLLFYATVLGDARARWLWEQIYGEAHPPADFLSFLWCEPTVKSQPARLEHAFRFGERSATFLRTGAQFGETLFALQTSGVRQGHYHRDRNSFIIEAFGERLVVDAGQISYSDPTHQELKKARLHNTVTADDIDQDFPKAPYVVVQRLCTTPAIDYIRADATNAYSRLRRSVRHVVFLRPATFVMIDEIAANEPVSASFNMMLLAPPRVNGATVRIMKRRAELLCRIVAPMDVEPLISQWRTDSGTGHHISLRTQAKAREHTLVTALVAMPKDAREPSIKPLTVSGGIGVAIAHGDARDIAAFRTSTREMRMSEFSTDARVVAIRFRNENVRAVALCDGARLTIGDFAVRTDKVTSALVHLRHRGVLVIGASGRDGATITVQLPEGAFTRQFMHRATALCRAANSKWREVGVRVNAQRRECAIRLPSADADWCIAVVNPPSGMSLDDYASPRITSVSVDGMVFDTTAEIYIGAKLPRVIRVEVEDDESAIDESALALICDGRVVRNAVRIISKLRGGKYTELECRIPHELQLPPTDGAPLMRRFILRIDDFGLYPHTAQIAFVHHSPMRIAKGAIFLSDLKPVRAFSHGGVKRDCDYFGDELSVAGMHFKKGLLIHPEVGRGAPFAEVVYDLTKLPPRRWFIAVVGIEDDASMRGSVTFCVEVLRNGDWQRIYESPVMRRIDGVRFVRVNIVGAKMLRLLCTDAGDSINSDHAVWGLARLE